MVIHDMMLHTSGNTSTFCNTLNTLTALFEILTSLLNKSTYWVDLRSFSYVSVIVATKFFLLISLLVFIRGSVPRYRYDYLTKIGWVKFLSLVLSLLVANILLVYLI